MLTKGLTDHTATVDARMAARSRVWLTVYCNKQGLSDTLIANDVCTSEQFEAFFLGFNQAAPLFSIIDVGTGKEAADTKIKGQYHNSTSLAVEAFTAAIHQSISVCSLAFHKHS